VKEKHRIDHKIIGEYQQREQVKARRRRKKMDKIVQYITSDLIWLHRFGFVCLFFFFSSSFDVCCSPGKTYKGDIWLVHRWCLSVCCSSLFDSMAGSLATYKFSSIWRGIGRISVPNSCSILWTANRSSCVIKLIARPKWPKRPERPIRWLNVNRERQCSHRTNLFV
jgi:hypothetical protein